MMDILTICLNPCVDISTATARVAPVHKLRCAAPVREPGGGGINVARVAQRLGAQCCALYAASGATGAVLQRLLDAEQVRGVCIPIQGETRESLHVRDLSAAQDYRFVMPGPTWADLEWQALLARLAQPDMAAPYWVASGSLPPGVPADFYARVAQLAHQQGSRLVLDASGPALAAALAQGVYLCKPSLSELRELTGRPLSTPSEWAAAAQLLVAQGKSEVVVLSLGADGALLCCKDTLVQAAALPVPVTSTVGAGDSLVGGMVTALAGGLSLRESFRHGVAAASAALLSSGTGLCQAPDVQRLLAQVVLVDTVDRR